VRDLERDNRRLVAEKVDLVRAADTRLEELSDLHKQGDEVIRITPVLRIRNKNFGSDFGSGSGLKLVLDSDLDQKLAKTSFFCSRIFTGLQCYFFYFGKDSDSGIDFMAIEILIMKISPVPTLIYQPVSCFLGARSRLFFLL
jgi:hypothetical protein